MQDRFRALQSVDTFLRSKFIYADELIETLQTPEYMLNGLDMTGHIVGDCDDISTLHAALLTCMGFPVQFVAIKSTQGDPNFDHVFIQARQNQEWLTFDITVPPDTPLIHYGKIEIGV